MRQEHLAAAVHGLQQPLVAARRFPLARKQTTLNGTGGQCVRTSALASTHAANSWARRMCSASRARMPSAPKCRSTIHSLSARKRRPSCMPVSIRLRTVAASDRDQVLGRQRERSAHHVHAPAVEHAQIERREQPLVRVDDQRVRAFCPAQHPLVARAPSPPPRRRRHRRATRPFALRRSRRSPPPDRRWWSTSCRPSPRRPSGASRRRDPRAIARASAVGTHPELVVAVDPPQRLVAEPEQDHRLVDRRVRLVRAVDPQPRQSLRRPGPARAPVDGRLARRGQGVQRGDRSGVVNHPFEWRRAGRSASRAIRARPLRARSPRATSATASPARSTRRRGTPPARPARCRVIAK